MFDDQNIYVACRCSDQHPERIVANDMRRDGLEAPPPALNLEIKPST